MENFIIQLLQRPRLALDSCSQMNWHWNWPDIPKALVGVGVLFTRCLHKHQVRVGTVLSPHLSIGLLSSWITVFLNWCSWKGFVVFLELWWGTKTDFIKMSLYLGNLGLSEDGTEKVYEWALDCDDIDTGSKNHRDDARNLFTAALNAFQSFRKFACMLRSWSSNREKMHKCAIAVRKLEVGSEIRGNFAIFSPLREPVKNVLADFVR